MLDRFNEAAGIPRGRRRSVASGRSTASSFNEAAGIPRGRPEAPRLAGAGVRASMRPRVFPAEDDGDAAAIVPYGKASMRPRVFPAEDAALERGEWRAMKLQ